MKKLKIVITCGPRISDILEREVQELGFPIVKKGNMSVETLGSFNDTLYLNMFLRTANKVLFEIEAFDAVNPDLLYEKAVLIPWEDYLEPTTYMTIDSYAKNDFILDTRFANLKLKDAIADRMMEKFGKRPNSGPKKDKANIYMHWFQEKVRVYFDTSGETIAKHGYRKIPMKAPMLEALGAATVLSTNWDKKSAFVNPMCGSGTLAIEAAMIAANMPPGLLRFNFGFMHIKGYSSRYWKHLIEETKRKIKTSLPFKIIASDVDREAISAAKYNAEKARVNHLIDFKAIDFKNSEMPEGGGVVILNPEYGLRLGSEKQLVHVYEQIGDFFKQKCSGYTGYVFTGNVHLSKQIGLKASRRMEFYNSKIDCRLLEYELYDGSKS